MNDEPPDADFISYEALEDSFDVNWNWDIPYRSRGVNVDANVTTIDHPSRPQEEIDLQEENLQLEVPPALRASHRKRIVKSYSKDGSHHKSHPSKDRFRRRKTDQMLQVARYRENPWSMIGPSSAPTSPFLPCTLPDSLMKQYLHQIPYTLAEMVSKGSSGAAYGKSFAMNVMSSITVSPALLHSILFAQMLHDRVHQGVHSATPIEVEVGANAVEHLNREISEPRRAVKESSIWAVVCLAYSGREATIRSGLQYPHQSFLKELQSIHIYCRMEVVVEHVLGLIKMIDMAGGLHNIKTPGIAQMISLAGIIGACRTVQKPIFPFIPHTTSFIQDGELNVTSAEFAAVSLDLGKLGTGFWDVWDVRSSSGMHEFFAVIQDACDFTVVVENYIRGRWMQRTSTEIMDQRNYIQHSLMSLKSYQELKDNRVYVDDLHYESGRLAVIIYSFLVIFPIPPVAGPFETLTRLLRRELERTSLKEGKLARLRIQLWILMMGAIASIGLPCRSWFISEMSLFARMANVNNWQHLQSILQTFLWHSGTNNIDGLDIWDDVEALSQKIS